MKNEWTLESNWGSVAVLEMDDGRSNGVRSLSDAVGNVFWRRCYFWSVAKSGKFH